MPGVAEICGDSLECLFDVGATGDLEVGRDAVEVQTTYNETVEVSQPSKLAFCPNLHVEVHNPLKQPSVSLNARMVLLVCPTMSATVLPHTLEADVKLVLKVYGHACTMILQWHFRC